jgi:serine O-acetyltransferase
MIRSHQEYKHYLDADRIALKREFNRYIIHDEIWKFQRLLRKLEYVMNCKRHKHIGWLLYYKYLSLRFHWKSVRIGFEIPPNTFGPGLSIAHRGTVVVHPDARVGKNCRIHVDVVIGTRPGPVDKVPRIGDNCYIGPGAKIYGDIVLGDNMAIGANSVVNRSFPEGYQTIAGIPARKISDKGSEEFIISTRPDSNE